MFPNPKNSQGNIANKYIVAPRLGEGLGHVVRDLNRHA